MKTRNLEQWLAHIESIHFRSIDLELDRVRAVLTRLLPAGPSFEVISVAGTNGKGSCVEMLGSILVRGGYRVGLYTSPHLVSYRERVRIDQDMATATELCAAFESIERAREEVPLTYFEFGTLAALLIFQRHRVEVAVLEVGMGGRLDAVNSVDPSASLITSIGLDHQHWLGHDRESIATEKAGILRTGVPAVCAEPDPPLAIADCAERTGARLFQLGVDFSYQVREQGWTWCGVDAVIENLPFPELPGEVQLQNAAGVVMVLIAMRAKLNLTDEAIREGLPRARVRGRFEVIEGSPRVILDVAHNEGAVLQVVKNLGEVATGGRILVVCGMLKDKPIDAISGLLSGIADAWYAGDLEGERGCPAQAIVDSVNRHSDAPANAFESVTLAFARAMIDARPEDTVLVLGSFHTVGDIIRALENDSIVG